MYEPFEASCVSSIKNRHHFPSDPMLRVKTNRRKDRRTPGKHVEYPRSAWCQEIHSRRGGWLKKWVAWSGPGERERCWWAEKLRGTPKVAVNRCLWSRLIASKSRASRQPSQRSLSEPPSPGFSFVFSSFPLLPLSPIPIVIFLLLSGLSFSV